MPNHDSDTAEALRQLRRWKQSVTPNGEPDPDLDESLDTLAGANPRAMLAAIVALLDEQLEQDVIAPLAAGPLEDLLGAHGDALIEEVEKLSKEHPPFRHALGGLWQNNMSDAVWERVLSAGPDQRW
ncbi:MAG: DUF6869 domain-containing protein [Caulobacterales bacterium]